MKNLNNTYAIYADIKYGDGTYKQIYGDGTYKKMEENQKKMEI